MTAMIQPSSPQPEWLALIGTIIRAVGAFAAGAGFGWANYVTGSTGEALITLLGLVAVAGWGVYNKFYLEWRTHRAAVASAQVGEPVQPPAVVP